LGIPGLNQTNIPILNPDLVNITQVSSGITHNLLLNSTGSVYGFGSNYVFLILN
jgi:alpha-tubulin suppressor-like RCC1 family protein